MVDGSINLAAPEAEEKLLSACLGSTAALMAVVGSRLKPEDFSSPGHELMFRAMRDMMDRGQSVNSTTLTNYLETSGKLDLLGGKGVIDRLSNIAAGAHEASDYSEIVRDRSIRRRLFDASEDIVNMIHSEPDVRTLISGSENMIYRVGDMVSGGAKDGMTASDLVELYRTRKANVDRIAYPFLTLNHNTNGRERGSLTVWGGFSSDGKTIIGMQSALAAANAGYSVGYFSMEMTEEELLYRLLSMHSGIPKHRIESGELDLHEDGLVGEAVHAISQLPIKTFHDPEYTPSEIRTIQMRERFDLVVIDYLQRFHFVDWQDIPRMAKQFKNMALSTKCAVDLLSQLTPSQVSPGKNPFPVPNMNSLYGGKATGHEANNVLFVWANRVKDPETGSWERDGTGSIISVKQRGGTGEFKFDVVFDNERIMWKEKAIENVYLLQKADTNK